jgi:hypothetical protein
LHANPSNAFGAVLPSPARQPDAELIAEDGRKFPVEVLRQTAIKSVTAVTMSGPTDFMNKP